MQDQIHIIIDTREQQPWSFQGYARCSRATLNAGDYALAADRGFSIERKSLDDFCGSVSSGWRRLCNEIERMEDNDYPARVIVVEANWMDVLNHKYNHPEVLPQFVFSRIAELTMRGVAVLFCDNPIAAAGMAWKLLVQRKRQLEAMEND